jgi:glycosyltransferase involved in cell wall biosynthesis
MKHKSSSKSVLMICPVFRPAVGGTEIAAERLSIKLVQLGFKVTVVTERHDPSCSKSEEVEGVRIQRLSQLKLLGSKVRIIFSYLQFSLFLLFNGRQFNVWHVHQHGVYAAISILLGRIVNRAVIMKVSSSGSNGLLSLNQTSRMSWILIPVLKRVNACVALTNETFQEVIQFGIPQERVFLVGNGIDTVKFCPTDRTDLDKHKTRQGLDTSRVALFVGRLVHEKNPLGLIQAWNIAVCRLPTSWKLVIVGDGPMRGVVEALIEELGLCETVRMVGAQTDVARWLQTADLFIVSSNVEGLSNACLEAMSCGVPIISTRVSGAAETIERSNCGCLVDVGNMNQLADALANLANKPDSLVILGARGRELIEKKYSINAIADRFSNLYLSLSR